jgi:hypothetical protein
VGELGTDETVQELDWVCDAGSPRFNRLGARRDGRDHP